VTTPAGTSPVSSADQYTYAQVAPTLTWATPAPITFGTPLSGTQLDATASVPGSFSYSPPAGTVLQPGTQTLTATFTPTDTTDFTTGTISVHITVGFSQACITTSHNGPLNIADGQSICVDDGGVVNGPITIAAGGALYVNDGAIHGPVTGTGVAALTVCAANISGPVTASKSAGPVLVGGSNCAGNSISGPVTITKGTGGLSFVGNTVHGPLTLTNNTGGFTYSGNTVTGPVTVSGNS
jgi:hypothetical protein